MADDLSAVGLRDRVDRALARLAVAQSAAARAATRALDLVLAGVRGSCWPEVAWRFSALTAGGCPVELSFSSGEPGIRYTAEVAGPETDNRHRLPAAEELLARLAPGPTLPADLRRRLVELQAGGELGWGAWLGGRHDGSGSRYKLYVEAPRDRGEAAARLAGELLGAPLPLAHRRPRVEGLGYEPANGRLELYCRLPGLEAWETGVLLLAAGLGARQGDLLDLMAMVYGRPMLPAFPRHRFGFSYTLGPGGTPAALTLFCYAFDALGSDARARRALQDVGPRLGWCLDGYREVSQPLEAVETAPTHHTVVAFTVAAAGPPALTIGLVPPDV
jgi:hypothetical protein